MKKIFGLKLTLKNIHIVTLYIFIYGLITKNYLLTMFFCVAIYSIFLNVNRKNISKIWKVLEANLKEISKSELTIEDTKTKTKKKARKKNDSIDKEIEELGLFNVVKTSEFDDYEEVPVDFFSNSKTGMSQ